MTVYRATVMHTPGNPFTMGSREALAVEQDGGVVVTDGVIVAVGPYETVRAEHPADVVEELGGILVPGFVDTHVHYPQIRAIGGLGMSLLDWLEKCALPEECRLGDQQYADLLANEFLNRLLHSGTTSALVFGAHFAGAIDALFAGALERGINVTSGLVLSDRILPEPLLTTPDRALAQSQTLIDRWHNKGRLRYAVTPRFSLSASDRILAACGELMGPDLWFTTHINENLAEIATVAELFPDARHYLDTYDRHGLIHQRSVLAHNVHVSDAELALMGERSAWVSHCPSSNAVLGSGLFPLRRHVENGVRVALGSDVGAGTGLYLPKESLQAYFMQQLLGADGLPLSPAHLLYLATRAGAQALGIADRVGDFSPGKEFDAVLWRAPANSDLDVNLRYAVDASDALARIFALATPADVHGVWLRGSRVRTKLAGDDRAREHVA